MKMAQSLFYDKTYICDVVITATKFSMISGSIYYSDHYIQSSISMFNLSVVSYYQFASNNTDSLFIFASTDVTAIEEMSVYYFYNISDSCMYHSQGSNSILNLTWDWSVCEAAVGLIHNSGEV